MVNSLRSKFSNLKVIEPLKNAAFRMSFLIGVGAHSDLFCLYKQLVDINRSLTAIRLKQPGRMSLPVALLQSYFKPEYHGRLMSFYRLELSLSRFGAFFAALLSHTIGVRWGVGGLAIGLIAFDAVVLLS